MSGVEGVGGASKVVGRNTSGPIGFFDSDFSLEDRWVPPGRLLLAPNSDVKMGNTELLT